MLMPEEEEARREKFWRLHESGCFVLPNAWDRGSARFLAAMGFEALGTTSAGLAFSLARPDKLDALRLDDTIQNVWNIVDDVPLPIQADLQNGYGNQPNEVQENVERCVRLGVAGLSIEDATDDPDAPLFELDDAVERIRAARAGIDRMKARVVLTGRAECFLVGHPDPLAASIERLKAYAEAGADCLYAPGLTTEDEVRAIVEAVAPKPVNVLATRPAWMNVERLAALGVRRISVGSALARVGWGAVIKAASEIFGTGSFESLAQAEPFDTFEAMFERRKAQRTDD